MASLNVAVMFAVRLTAVALAAGVRADTVGAGPVMNVHELTAPSALPAMSRMPVGPPVSVTVYFVSGTRSVSGLNTHRLAIVACLVSVPVMILPAGSLTTNVAFGSGLAAVGAVIPCTGSLNVGSTLTVTA